MSKLVKLTGIQVGGDINTVDIYHTSISPSNLISSSVSASLLTSTGITFEVEDNITTFLAFVSGGVCFGTSGSVTASVYNRNTRFFNIHSTDDAATVSIVYPTADGPTTGTLTQTVNFNTYSTFVISADATPGYPDVTSFDGWYDSATGGNLISTNNPLTITVNSFTGSRGDEFYAYFS